MNVAEWLVRTARLSPYAPALMSGTDCVADYAFFARTAGSIAAGLVECGALRGDRIALLLPNRVEYLQVLYGIWLMGAVAVPINYKLHPVETAYIIEQSEAKIVFTIESSANAVSTHFGSAVRTIAVDATGFAAFLACQPIHTAVRRDRDDLAWLFYTSGTTGRPKGAMLSHGNLLAMALSYFVDVDDVRPSDSVVYAAPMSHGAGLYNFMHVIRGCRHVVPASGSFDSAEVLELAKRLRGVSMFASPTMLRRLVERVRVEGGNGEGIRTIVYGGAPMYVCDIEEAVSLMGDRFVQIYGQGESPMTITALSRAQVADRRHPRWRERLGSVGTARSCVEVRVADAEGRAVPTEESGEILVRGATLMLGYWRDSSATASTLRDGWLATGDVGALDQNGFLSLKDRLKDVIISGGSNIYPREVEEALLTHPDVHEVAVVGRASPEWGEDVVAFVVPKTGTTSIDPGKLDRHCLERIARFKRPKAYYFERELPRNSYGKVLKTRLRDLCQGGRGP